MYPYLKRLSLTTVATYVVLTFALLLAPEGSASGGRFVVTTLLRAAPAGHCNAYMFRGTPHYGGWFTQGPDLCTLYCGIDTVRVPIADITTATIKLQANAPLNHAPALQVCFRSMDTGASTCGTAVYGTVNSGVQTIIASRPSGTFDENHVAYLSVFLNNDTVSFYAFTVNKVTWES